MYATRPGATRLAVNHSGRRARLSASRLTPRHDEGVVQRGKNSTARPCIKTTLHSRIGWEVLGQLPPLATGGRNVEDRIYHRPHVSCTWTPEGCSRRQKRRHHKPLRIGGIAFIPQALAPIMSTSDLSPSHRTLPRIFANPKELQLAEITQLLFQSGSKRFASVQLRAGMTPVIISAIPMATMPQIRDNSRIRVPRVIRSSLRLNNKGRSG